MGKALNTPVFNLLGGCCQPHIPLEWSVSMADDVSVMIAEASRAVLEFGVKVLCVKAADRRGWRQDVEHFEAIRRAVGDEVDIGIDSNTDFVLRDGHVDVPRGPGLGVTIDEAALKKHALQHVSVRAD